MEGRGTEKVWKIFSLSFKVVKTVWKTSKSSGLCSRGRAKKDLHMLHSIPPDFLHPQPQSPIWCLVPGCVPFPTGCCMHICCQGLLLCTGPLKSSIWKTSQWAWVSSSSLCCDEREKWASAATVPGVSAWEMEAVGLHRFVFSWYSWHKSFFKMKMSLF